MAKITIKRDGEKVSLLVDGRKIFPVCLIEDGMKLASELNFKDKVEFEADPIFVWKEGQGLKVMFNRPGEIPSKPAPKPPLGVMPCYLAAEKRINDLADGIKRQLKAEKPNYNLINRWAEEIKNQIDIIEFDRSYDEN